MTQDLRETVVERDYALANLAEVESMLAKLTDEDAVTRISLLDLKEKWLAALAEPSGKERGGV